MDLIRVSHSFQINCYLCLVTSVFSATWCMYMCALICGYMYIYFHAFPIRCTTKDRSSHTFTCTSHKYRSSTCLSLCVSLLCLSSTKMVFFPTTPTWFNVVSLFRAWLVVAWILHFPHGREALSFSGTPFSQCGLDVEPLGMVLSILLPLLNVFSDDTLGLCNKQRKMNSKSLWKWIKKCRNEYYYPCWIIIIPASYY